MSPADTDLEVIEQLLDLSPDERRSKLKQVCGADSAWQSRLISLLERYERADELLRIPVLRCIEGTEFASHLESIAEVDRFLSRIHDARCQACRESRCLGCIATYHVHSVLGKGASGVVLKAVDPELNCEIAIKLLRPHLAESQPIRERFLREARAMARLNHEHIVRVWRYSEIHTPSMTIPWFAMDLIHGETLEELINRAGPLKTDTVARIAVQLCSALREAHANQLIHRDIKPANILFKSPVPDGSPQVLITDFGISQAVEAPSLTETGAILGTPMYMSPEQANFEPATPLSDLFSLGGVLYFLSCGVPPFGGQDRETVRRLVLNTAPENLQQRCDDVPTWLSDAIAKLQAKCPRDRFLTAKEAEDYFANSLECITRNQTVPSPLKTSMAKRRWVIKAVAVLLLLSSTGYYRIHHFRTEDPTNRQAKSQPQFSTATLVSLYPKRLFVPLFTDSTLDGWTPKRSSSIEWTNENGVVTGRNRSGAENSGGQLSSDEDYQDFHFRCEVLAGSGRDAILLFRNRDVLKPGARRGFALVEPTIHASEIETGWGYGSLYSDDFQRYPKECRLAPSAVDHLGISSGDWYTLEFIAVQNEIEVRINSITTLFWRTDDPRLTKPGRIVLRCGAAANLTIRNVMIRNLSIAESPGTEKTAATSAAGQQDPIIGRWKLTPARASHLSVFFEMHPDGRLTTVIPADSAAEARQKGIPETGTGRWVRSHGNSYRVTFFNDNALMDAELDGDHFSAVNAMGDHATASRIPK